MKNIGTNLRQVPIVFYVLSVLICVAFILLSTAYSADDPKQNESMLMYMVKGGNTLPALYMWHNALSSSDMNTWLLILTPLICSVSYVYTFSIDMNSRCYLFSLNRQGLRKFTLSRFIGSGLYASIIMLSSLMIAFVAALIYSHELGSYSYAPICEMLIHKQSDFLAFAEVCITYACYAFFIGVLSVTLASFVSNSFTSCSALVLLLFMMGDMQSSYHSRFYKSVYRGEVTPDDYNHFTDFLFVGNPVHGMPDFENSFSVPYEVYITVCIAVFILMYILFHAIIKKKVII